MPRPTIAAVALGTALASMAGCCGDDAVCVGTEVGDPILGDITVST